jgi:hypothetical protein
VVRGEIPVELGASWFSPKCVEAQRSIKMGSLGVKHCFGAGCESGTKSWQTKNTGLAFNRPVRQWGISFIVKRETAQITS